jgi:excisionase family DNA binding protein
LFEKDNTVVLLRNDPPRALAGTAGHRLCCILAARHRAPGGRFEVLSGGSDNLLTVRQVAERLQVSPATVYKLCERGELEHVRVGHAIRVTPAALDGFICRRSR